MQNWIRSFLTSTKALSGNIQRNQDKNQERRRSGRVMIVTTLAYFSASPSLMNTIHLLLQEGYEVDIVGRSSAQWPMPQFDDPRVSFHLSPWNTRIGVPGMAALRQLLLVIKAFLLRRPDVVLAIDTEGLALSGLVAVLFRIPLIHYSLEVRFPTNWQMSIQKRLERFLYRFIKFTITQDEVRAKTLLESNHMQCADFIYIPNTSGFSQPSTTKSNYLRQRWNLPDSQKIILSAGNICPMTLAEELILAAKKWPADWTLVVHGWGEDPKYVDRLRGLCDGQHIILSKELVPYEHLDLLVNSADIGIALYSPINRNVYDMAKSSGKIWQYLRCGLPVVTIDFPSLQEIVSEGQFGLCVRRSDDVQYAVEQILIDYSGYSTRAREYYYCYGDFVKNFQPVLIRIPTFPQTNQN